MYRKTYIKKSGFVESDYSHYIHENKKYEQITISLDDDYDGIAISMSVACNNENNIKEATEFEEYLEEFFKFKKKKSKTETTKKEYPVNKVKSDVRKIKSEVKRMFGKEEDLKKYLNNGLSMASDKETFEENPRFEKEKGDMETYKSGDWFIITYMDLWDYKGGNPRNIINDMGEHPVYDADNLVRKLLKKLLDEKFTDFEVDEYGGDWDTSHMTISLK